MGACVAPAALQLRLGPSLVCSGIVFTRAFFARLRWADWLLTSTPKFARLLLRMDETRWAFAAEIQFGSHIPAIHPDCSAVPQILARVLWTTGRFVMFDSNRRRIRPTVPGNQFVFARADDRHRLREDFRPRKTRYIRHAFWKLAARPFATRHHDVTMS